MQEQNLLGLFLSCWRNKTRREARPRCPDAGGDFSYFVNRLVNQVEPALRAYRRVHPRFAVIACPFLLRGRSGSQCRRDPLRPSWVLGNCFGTAPSCCSRPEGRYPTSATPCTLGRSSGSPTGCQVAYSFLAS